MQEKLKIIKEIKSWFKENSNPCILCPRKCRVDREKKLGFCKVKNSPFISGYGPHFGEESCLVGTGGSGTIFFSGCNLRCVFCQNYEISQLLEGSYITIDQLAGAMLDLQKKGCHNINLVTPTHQIFPIILALEIAIEKGLSIPIVYNSSGYDDLKTLKHLRGIIDIYMPDFKIWDKELSKKIVGAKNYAQITKEAIKEMHSQVGDLVVKNAVAQRGLIIRHLILPGNLDDTYKILKFIRDEISKNTYVNLMGHYHPCWKAYKNPPLDRELKKDELKKALEIADEIGLKRLDKTHLALLAMILE